MTLKKSTQIRIWILIIAGIFLILGLFSQCAMNKPQAIASMVNGCVQNVPLSKIYQADLQRFGIKENTPELAQHYCRCTIEKPLQNLTDKEIRHLFSRRTSSQQFMEKLGGEKATQQRNDDCLLQWKNKKT